jgi:hypothetical protein
VVPDTPVAGDIEILGAAKTDAGGSNIDSIITRRRTLTIAFKFFILIS